MHRERMGDERVLFLQTQPKTKAEAQPNGNKPDKDTADENEKSPFLHAALAIVFWRYGWRYSPVLIMRVAGANMLFEPIRSHLW